MRAGSGRGPPSRSGARPRIWGASSRHCARPETPWARARSRAATRPRAFAKVGGKTRGRLAGSTPRPVRCSRGRRRPSTARSRRSLSGAGSSMPAGRSPRSGADRIPTSRRSTSPRPRSTRTGFPAWTRRRSPSRSRGTAPTSSSRARSPSSTGALAGHRRRRPRHRSQPAVGVAPALSELPRLLGRFTRGRCERRVRRRHGQRRNSVLGVFAIAGGDGTLAAGGDPTRLGGVTQQMFGMFSE